MFNHQVGASRYFICADVKVAHATAVWLPAKTNCSETLSPSPMLKLHASTIFSSIFVQRSQPLPNVLAWLITSMCGGLPERLLAVIELPFYLLQSIKAAVQEQMCSIRFQLQSQAY